MADVIDSMLDLMRRLPPTRTEENVGALVDICPDEADELLQSVDQPLQVMVDRATGREYLACDYNRDGESYRCATPSVYIAPVSPSCRVAQRRRVLLQRRRCGDS